MKKFFLMAAVALGGAGMTGMAGAAATGDFQVLLNSSAVTYGVCQSPSANITQQGSSYILHLNCMVATSVPREGGRSQGNMTVYTPQSYTYNLSAASFNSGIITIFPGYYQNQQAAANPTQSWVTLVSYKNSYPPVQRPGSYPMQIQQGFPFSIWGDSHS